MHGQIFRIMLSERKKPDQIKSVHTKYDSIYMKSKFICRDRKQVHGGLGQGGKIDMSMILMLVLVSCV